MNRHLLCKQGEAIVSGGERRDDDADIFAIDCDKYCLYPTSVPAVVAVADDDDWPRVARAGSTPSGAGSTGRSGGAPRTSWRCGRT